MDFNTIRHPSRIKKIKCSFLDYVQLLMIGRTGRWTLTPSATPLRSKKWNACFWIMFNFWWSVGLVDGLEPRPPPFSSQKNEMLIFRSRSTSDDRLMDSNPGRHPSPVKKRLPPLSSQKNACFWIMFNFWWLAGLVDGLEPHPPLCSIQKNKMLVFGLCSTSDDRPGWLNNSNPVRHPSPAKNIKCLFCITFNFWWLAGLVHGH